MDNKKMTMIEQEEYFEKECMPLLKELTDKCFLGNIPCFFTAAVKNNDTETKYIADGFLTGSSGIQLFDDKIKYHMMIQGGCVAKPKQEMMEVSLDAFMGDYDAESEF